VANEDSALREVDKELAEERQWALFRKHGPSLIAAAISVVAVVGGWQFWNARQESVAAERALEFKNAVELLAENQDEGRAALEAIAGSGAGGYGVLARLHQAASFARNGERLAALDAYRALSNDSAAPKRVRELARLRAAYQSMADGRDAVIASLDGLDGDESVTGFYAREILALAAIEEKDYETAFSMFMRASTDLSAPAGVRERAEEFAALAASGRAGVNITGEARIEDLVKAVGEAGALEGAQASGDAAGEDNPGNDTAAGEAPAANALQTETDDNGNE